ncbi:MAG TPA: alpha/beta fold hydrolase [Candidatus Acidoferrales bacterium]|jgi:esterase|nr:alpha/beta fold hydrolase [Candidatus Acidoferrales bacterium]
MQLNFKQLGQGEPLVLLHGLFGSADNWFGVAPKLAEKFHVFILDLRNHGQSPHDEQMDYPLMAADVEKFFAAHHLEQASVIGHSMGGKVAMQFALDYPQRVKKLVVVDMAPRPYKRAHDYIFEALLALDLERFQTRGEMEEALAPKIPSLNLRRFLLKNLGRDNAGKFFWKMNLRGVSENYARLGEVLGGKTAFTGPTLFIRGGKSDYITDADEVEIRERFPAVKIETIAKANHWVHAEAPEEFVRLVLDFL